MNLNYGKDRKRGVDFLAPQFPRNSGLNSLRTSSITPDFILS